MTQLVEKRVNKNQSFYTDMLENDYASNESKGKSSTKASKKAPTDLDESQSNDAKDPYKVNTKLAQKDPLKFIDSVLKHHGQI